MVSSSPIIMSGELRGRRLKVPKTRHMRPTHIIRPTLGRCKKTLFDIIAAHTPKNTRRDKIFADIFAGSGSVGLEALSIGFGHAYFIENHPHSLAVLQENIAFAPDNTAHIIKADAFHPREAPASAHIVFFDPPYDIDPQAWEPLLDAYRKSGWVQASTWLIAQHASDCPPPLSDRYRVTDRRLFGKTTLTFISCE